MAGKKRFVNRGTISAIPSDYAERWVADDTANMTFSGDDITAWDGQVAATTFSVGSMTNPTPTTMNGVPVVSFDLDDGMEVTNHSWNDSGTNSTYFIAIQLPATITVNGVYWAFDNDNTTSNAQYGGNSGGGLNYFNVPSYYTATDNWESRGMLYSARHTSNTTFDRWFGCQAISQGTRTTSSAGAADWKIGSFGTTANKSVVGISEIIIYDRELDQHEVHIVQNYLCNKYNLGGGDAVDTQSGGTSYLPPDYAHRYDAANPASITYATDPATNDVNGWLDETGELDLSAFSITATNPEYINDPDGYPCVHFQSDGGLQAAYTHSADSTCIFVCRFKDKTNGGPLQEYALGSGPSDVRVFNYTHTSTAPCEAYFGDQINSAVGEFDDRRELHTFTNRRQGTNNNDLVWYVGQTSGASQLNKSDAIVATTNLTIGTWLSGAADYDMNGYVYECVIWHRRLTEAERTSAIDYMARKWGVSLLDTDAPDVVADSKQVSWVSDGPDPKGLQCTVGTPNNIVAESILPNDSTPRRGPEDWSVNTKYGRAVKGKMYHFRADVTGGMTFATGDAESGGTVSSWTDIYSNHTMDTTTSGDSAVTFIPNHKGFPCIQGGTSGTPRSLEVTVAPSYVTGTGDQKMYACAVAFADGTATNTILDLHNGAVRAEVDGAFYQDLVTSRGHVTPFVDCGTGVSNLPASVRDATEGIWCFVWRITDLGTTSTVETWVNGLKMPDRVGTAATVAAAGNMAVGARVDSTNDSNGYLYEFFGCNGTGTDYRVSDGMVLSTMRYLCDKYGEDYMPETTPMDIGLHARSSATVAATDCCFWWDAKDANGTGWPLQEYCAELHTTPANYKMISQVAYDRECAVVIDKTLKAPVVVFDEHAADSGNQHWETASTYSSTETTDFPADTLGMSAINVAMLGEKTTTADGARIGNGVCQLRKTAAGNVKMFSGNTGIDFAGTTDEWAIWACSYAYDDDGTGTLGYPGSTDGDPAAYFYRNNDAVQTLDTSTATSYTMQPFCNWDAADGVGRCAEMIVYKHPVTIDEINRLREYFMEKYDYNFEFDDVRPAHQEFEMDAHWNYSGNKVDSMATYAALAGGAYSAYDGPNPHALQIHDHNGGTSGHNMGSRWDSGLDTLGAFTWTAMIWLDSYNTGSNWRPFFRSAPPSGGSGGTNNIRHGFRVNDSTGIMRYLQQHGSKVTDTYDTTMVCPLQQWVFIGVSRSADGTTVNFLVDDTFEQATGFTAPDNGTNSRWEMWEEWDGDDFDGYVQSVTFRTSYTTEAGLRRLRKQQHPSSTG